MPELVKRSLLRSLLIILTIIGALYVFGVVYNVREGAADPWQIALGVLVIVGLVLLNRWWMNRSGTRI